MLAIGGMMLAIGRNMLAKGRSVSICAPVGPYCRTWNFKFLVLCFPLVPMFQFMPLLESAVVPRVLNFLSDACHRSPCLNVCPCWSVLVYQEF